MLYFHSFDAWKRRSIQGSNCMPEHAHFILSRLLVAGIELSWDGSVVISWPTRLIQHGPRCTHQSPGNP